MLKFLIDTAAGFTLLFALSVVFVVDLVRTRPNDPSIAPSVNTLEHVKVIGGDKEGVKRLKLGVTPTAEFVDKFNKTEKWDDMGKLLDELGEGYRYEKVTINELVNGKKNNEYDVIFLTCHSGGEEEMKDVLRNYVSDGGILYASDWRYAAVAKAFPDMVDKRLAGAGAKQELDADIVDADLREVLSSKKIRLKFDLPDWKTAGFGGPRVKTLIQGNYIKDRESGKESSGRATAPLMVKFQFGKGTVLFTSFHNEKQNSEIEKKLLQYLVFSLVTANIDMEVSSRLGQSGFTPQRSNLLSTPKRNQSIVKTYENTTAGDLRFALGFRNEGAKLQFNIKSPDGKEFTRVCESTAIFEVSNAKAGTWTYTVTDLHLPYENFPFTVTVGEKK